MDKLIANRYEILEQLGAGGMGAVYLVHDKLRNQQVALKQMLTSNDHQRLALTREFRLLSTLRHPNIVGVSEYGFHEKQPYFTMDYLAHAKPFKQLSGNKIDGFVQILQALGYLHRRGILHGDLKPANVLVTAEGQVKVLDFGLARENIRNKNTSIRSVAGTLTYISPEILKEEAPSIGSDLWAVGVMLCEMLTGHHPFSDTNPMTLIFSILHKPPNLEGLDEEFSPILERLLAKDPNERYPNAQAIIQELYLAIDAPIPSESTAHRESFLKAAAFVGREKDYQHLVAALHSIHTTQGQIYLIGGEAGAGKSRLLDELRTQALVEGFVVLQGQGVEGGGLPYQLWRDIARRLVLTAPMSDLNASILKEIVPDIGDLIGHEVADLPVFDLSANRKRLVSAFLERFRLVDAPILIILEDLHWATESLDLLKLFLPHFETMPVLVIGSYRHDERPNLPQELPNAQTLKLERFTLEAIADLTASMLGAENAPAKLVERLADESEGNALFMVEVLRTLAEEVGSLSNIANHSLPASIFAGGMMAVLQRRLAKVPLWTVNALQLSAIIGRKIDLRLLAQLGISELETWLQTCADAFVLEPYQGDWRFSHDRLRDVMLKDSQEIANLHEQVALAIEAVYPNDAIYDEALVEHWRMAGNAEKEVFYIIRASRRLIRIRADYATANLLIQRGLAHNLEHSLAELYIGLGSIAEAQGLYETSLKHFQKGLEFHPKPTIQARLLFGMGYSCVRQARYSEAIEYAEQSLAIAKTYHDYANLAEGLNLRGALARYQGDFAEAKTYFENSILAARELGEAWRWSVAVNLTFLGLIAIHYSDFKTARQHYDESIRIRREIGDYSGIGVSLTNIAELDFFEGNYADSLALYQESLSVFQTLKDKDVIFYPITGLIMTNVQLGDYQSARSYLVEALHLSLETNALPMMFVSLLAASYWQQDLARAAAWIGLLTAQSSTEVTDDLRFKQRSLALKDTLGESAFKSALESGKSWDVKIEIQNLFNELSAQ